MVTFDTVREQLLYEVHDPARYLNPDVTADFTSLTLTDLGGDRVRVSGTRGTPPPPTYKGLVCTPAGWAGEATFAYSVARRRGQGPGRGGAGCASGPSAPALPVQEWCEEYFGAGAFHGPAYDVDRAEATAAGWEPPEVLGRLAWRTADPRVGRGVSRGRGVLGLSGPPMISRLRPGARWASRPSCSRSRRSPSTATSSTAQVRDRPRRVS